MRPLYSLIAAATATMLTTACGASAPAPVQAPSRSVDVETRAQSPRRRDLPPPLVAPPPAYGNKIVMAQRETPSTKL
jgi:hypothetical protein